MIEIAQRAHNFQNNPAILSDGKTFSYRELLSGSKHASLHLLSDQSDLNSQRVAFMVTPGFDYVKVQWGIWRAGGIAVPLNPVYPFASYNMLSMTQELP